MSKSNPALMLLPDAPSPLYARLTELLRLRILDGTYPPHGRMPSESELCTMFGVSRITVRQALGDLQKAGLIFRIHGKGTFVSRPKAFQNVTALEGFGEAMSRMGYEIINRVDRLHDVPADARVAQKLGLAEGDPVTEIRRVRLLNREPVSLELTWLPAALGEGLNRHELVTRDIFLMLENDCGVPLGHADIAMDAVLADEDLMQALQIEEGAPVMHIERLTHAADGRPVDYEHLYFRGDAFQYRFRVDRAPRREGRA